MSTDPEQVRAMAESYWAAEERRDVAAIMAHYAPNATYQDGAGALQGQDAIRGFYETSVREYPALEVRITRVFPAADGSAIEFVATLHDRAGQAWRIEGVNVFQAADGRFTAVRSYEDPPRLVDG